jgi:Domain of unknown function (DUF2017)
MLSLGEGPDGRLVLRDVDTPIAFCLLQVPAIVARRDDPEMRSRIYPDATAGDAARNAEWHRLMDGELRHLFESAARTLERDLGAFDVARREVAFPAAHLTAWMTAINQARVVLAELHGFGESDLASTELDADDPRGAALVELQILGYVLQVLVERGLEGA